MAPSTNRLSMTRSFSCGCFVDGPLDPGAPPDLVPTGSQRDHEGFAPLPPVVDFPKGVARPTEQRRHPAHRTPPLAPAASTRPDAAYAFISEPPREHQDDEDQEDEADAAARIGAPARAVTPRRQGPDQNEYQDDDQDQ